MKIIYVDDERNAHINFHYDVKDRAEVGTLECFFTGEEALAYAREHEIDGAFLDISLGGGENGVDLAIALKEIQPTMEVVFLTAYDEYARKAYHVGGRAYLTKPYTLEELDEALGILQRLTATHQLERNRVEKPKERIVMQTMGNFDMVVDSRPIAFRNSKAKELLAYLVHLRGGTANSSQIFLTLWESREYNAATSTYVRRVVRSLKEDLEAIGLGDLLICKRNCYSVDPLLYFCDVYALMDGDVNQAGRFNGEYMNQYSWGESTVPLLDRRVQNLLQNSSTERE